MNYEAECKTTDLVLGLLVKFKTERMRRDNKYGASLSHVLTELRFAGLRGFHNTHDLADVLEILGFRVVPILLKGGVEHKYNRCVTL